jgi:hypothetical protein
LEKSEPVKNLIDLLQTKLQKAPLQIDRNALLKVSQHKDLFLAVKMLKQLSIGKVERYRPIVKTGGSEYDVGLQLSKDQSFDQFLNQKFSSEVLGNDISARHKLLMNEFERLLHDAEVSQIFSIYIVIFILFYTLSFHIYIIFR